MPLNEINNNLYSNSSNEKTPEPKEDSFGNRKVGGADNIFSHEDVWKKDQKGFSDKTKKKIRIALAILAAILLLAASAFAFFIIRRNAFREDRVDIVFEGPLEVVGAENIRYVVKIKNDNRVKLSNVEISFNYSENLRLKQEDNKDLEIFNSNNSKMVVGEIGPRQEKEIVLVAKFYSPQDFQTELKAKLSYSPGDYSNKYERAETLGIKTISSPVIAELTAPVSATDGDLVAYVIDYKNVSDEPFMDTQLSMVYPEGFEFVSAEPKTSQGNNIWKIGEIKIDKEGKITIMGKIRGRRGESKPALATIGKISSDGTFIAYDKSEKNISITEPPFALYQEAVGINGNTVNPGDNLEYAIKFRNNGQDAIKDVIIKMEIKSRILDFSKIRTEKGYYDSKDNTITWKYSEIPALTNVAVNTEGTIKLSVPVLSTIPVASEKDKNDTIFSVVRADSPSLLDPTGSHKIISSSPTEIKLNTKAILEVKGFRQDPNIENFGSLPLRLGEETSYVLHWEITNVSNDISETRVVSTLPSGVKWTGKTYPEGEKISYDIRTNEIVWEPGKLKAGVGILSPKKTVSFQVSIVPQPNQKDQPIRIMNASKLVCKDDFTGKEIWSEQPEKTTALREDSSINSDWYNFRL